MAGTGTHGSMDPFDPAEEDWEAYVERAEIYLAANKITDPAQKRDILLTVCGHKTYHILRDLPAPKKPTESSYADIVKLLKEHYNPKQGVAVKRYKFNTRARLPGESVATYVAELRHLAIDCEFGDALNDMLRDRLFCGVNDPRIQRRLLSEAALDFDKAMEMADRDAENFKDAGSAESTTTAVAGAVHKAGQAPLKTVTGVGVSTEPQSAATKRRCVTIVGKKGTLSEPAVSAKDKGTGPAQTQ